MTAKIETLVYLLLIFLLPTQLGKHFWPSFSFVQGLRIDYLSPTLYMTDILIAILVILCFYQWAVKTKKNYEFSKKNIIIGIFCVSIGVGIFTAKNQPIALYGVVKLLEMGFFAWYTSSFLQNKKQRVLVSYALLMSIFMESLLAIAQFWTHGSINGILYYLGERHFTAITPGIANASLGGELVLRPYGTLPHPNVLAGFLLIALIFLISQWRVFLGKRLIVVGSILMCAIVSIGISLSRITIATALLVSAISLFIFIKETKKRLLLFGVGMIFLGSFLGNIVAKRFMSTSFLEESFVIRADLTKSALDMIQAHFFWGVGLMNFLVRLPDHVHLQNVYLTHQPVHNIFLLLLAEVGVFGFICMTLFLYKTVQHIYYSPHSSRRTGCFFMLGSIGLLGMFDHYFITLQQGQLLLAFVIGCCWSLEGYRKKK